MIDELAVGLIQLIGRFLFWFFVEVLLHLVAYGLGYVTMKFFTFGKYPKEDTKEELVIGVGIGVLLLPIVVSATYILITYG